MFRRIAGHVRRQPVAFIALFFALGGGAMAASTVIKSTDTIPAGDLAGSTYGNPLIARNAVTNDKLANPSLSLNAGTGLTGGGSIALGGSGSLSVDPAVVQSRVTGSCSSGNAVSSVNQDGTVGCQSTGLQFRTASGTTGPTLSQPGTYFVVAEAGIFANGSALSGDCFVSATGPNSFFDGGYDGAVNLSANAAVFVAFSGMLVVKSVPEAVPATTSVVCADTSGNTVTPTQVRWWVTPVGSS